MVSTDGLHDRVLLAASPLLGMSAMDFLILGVSPYCIAWVLSRSIVFD